MKLSTIGIFVVIACGSLAAMQYYAVWRRSGRPNVSSRARAGKNSPQRIPLLECMRSHGMALVLSRLARLRRRWARLRCSPLATKPTAPTPCALFVELVTRNARSCRSNRLIT